METTFDCAVHAEATREKRRVRESMFQASKLLSCDNANDTRALHFARSSAMFSISSLLNSDVKLNTMKNVHILALTLDICPISKSEYFFIILNLSNI